MGKLTKMELYLVCKGKMWWVLILCGMCFVMFFTIMTYYTSTGEISTASDINIENLQNDTNSSQLDMSFVDYCENIICSDAILMFVTIFSILLVMQEYSHGYIKNIWTHIGEKRNFFLSKIIVLMIFVLFIFLSAIFTVWLCDGCLLKTEKIGGLKEFVKICMVQYLLEVAFGTVVMAVSLVVRKLVPALIIGIVYVALGQNLLCSVINLGINKILELDKTFEIEYYMIYGNIQKIIMNIDNEYIFRAIVVAIIYWLIFYVIAVISLKKYDVSIN